MAAKVCIRVITTNQPTVLGPSHGGSHLVPGKLIMEGTACSKPRE